MIYRRSIGEIIRQATRSPNSSRAPQLIKKSTYSDTTWSPQRSKTTTNSEEVQSLSNGKLKRKLTKLLDTSKNSPLANKSKISDFFRSSQSTKKLTHSKNHPCSIGEKNQEINKKTQILPVVHSWQINQKPTKHYKPIYMLLNWTNSDTTWSPDDLQVQKSTNWFEIHTFPEAYTDQRNQYIHKSLEAQNRWNNQQIQKANRH